MIAIQDFLAKFQNVKRTGENQWEARCPSHEDNRASLHIAMGDKGIVLDCKAGCRTHDVVWAVDCKMTDLFLDGPKRKSANGHYEKRPKGKDGKTIHPTPEEAIAAVRYGVNKQAEEEGWGFDLGDRMPDCRWVYTNADGEPVGEVLRWNIPGGKILRPIRRNGSGWSTGGMPTPRPLYRLPDVIAAAAVFVAEGEKAADAVRYIGEVATCCTNGAKAADKTDWTPLAGKQVILLPDNDGAGKIFADDVTAILAGLDPLPIVKVVRLPGLPAKGDAYEWVYDLRGTAEALRELAAEAEEIDLGTITPPPKRMPWTQREGRDKETGGKLSAKDDLDPEQAARAFLRDEFGYKGPDPTKPFEGVDPLELKIRYHREQFWIYVGDRYSSWSPDNVKARLVLYLQQSYCDLESKHINNTLLHLKAICQVADSDAMPTWLCSGLLPVGDPSTRFAAVQNGLVDIEAAVSGKGETLIPHSPRWFSTVCLPFDYDPAATCPTWEVILNRNLDDDAELIAVVQEFFGYCLATGTDLHAFFLAYGDGGTGKSATMGALRAMLGDANVSSVPLERLGDRFGLWDTYGKLANIAAEIGEVDRVAEGVLKSLTSGDLMQFERKFKDPVSAIPTAKLAFATNTLPRFVDHSEGLWRRMLIVPFNRKVTEAERIPGLDKPEGWAKIGELPGMFNWSLEGLRRLRRNGRFTKAAAVEALKLEYRKDCNPAAQFLEDNVREHPHGEILKSKLYDEYRTYCCNWGFRAVGASNFAKEVRRMFPSVDDVSRRNEQGGRDRGWVGITEGAEHGDLEAISTGDSSYYASEF